LCKDFAFSFNKKPHQLNISSGKTLPALASAPAKKRAAAGTLFCFAVV
jgi:hypothetical protein